VYISSPSISTLHPIGIPKQLVQFIEFIDRGCSSFQYVISYISYIFFRVLDRKYIPALIFFEASPTVANTGPALFPVIDCKLIIADNRICLLATASSLMIFNVIFLTEGILGLGLNT
jgi:hypothetical protein